MPGELGQAAILSGVIRIDFNKKVIFDPSQIWKEVREVPIPGGRVF